MLTRINFLQLFRWAYSRESLPQTFEWIDFFSSIRNKSETPVISKKLVRTLHHLEYAAN